GPAMPHQLRGRSTLEQPNTPNWHRSEVAQIPGYHELLMCHDRVLKLVSLESATSSAVQHDARRGARNEIEARFENQWRSGPLWTIASGRTSGWPVIFGSAPKVDGPARYPARSMTPETGLRGLTFHRRGGPSARGGHARARGAHASRVPPRDPRATYPER